jgi:hypothetical protein
VNQFGESETGDKILPAEHTMSGVNGKHMTQQSDHATYAVRLLSSRMPRHGIWLHMVFERGAGVA